MDKYIQIKSIPTLPGIYQFKNKNDKVIYIGKAKNLKNRLRSYFQNQKNQSSKTISMMKNAKDLEWIVVENEVEALLTEANLIKKYRPKYNVLMKDDKSYIHIFRLLKSHFHKFCLQGLSRKMGQNIMVHLQTLSVSGLFLRLCIKYFQLEVVVILLIKIS